MLTFKSYDCSVFNYTIYRGKISKTTFFVPHSIPFHYYHHVHTYTYGTIHKQRRKYGRGGYGFVLKSLLYSKITIWVTQNYTYFCDPVTSFIDAQLLKYECSTTHAVSTTTIFNAANLSQNQRVIARKLKVNKLHWLDIW